MIAEMPRLLGDLVRSALEAELDLDVLTTDVALESLESASAVEDADIVILCEAEPAADDYAAVLYAHPRIRLIGISQRGRDAYLYELRPRRHELGELSPASLLRAVRVQNAAHEEQR